LNGCARQQRSFKLLNKTFREGQESAYSVENLCFEIDDDFIFDLSGVAYCMYEGVAEGA